MLKKATNYEKIITIVLILMMGMFLIYLIIDRSIIDIIYLLLGSYYFSRFLVIKNRR